MPLNSMEVVLPAPTSLPSADKLDRSMVCGHQAYAQAVVFAFACVHAVLRQDSRLFSCLSGMWSSNMLRLTIRPPCTIVSTGTQRAV